MIGIICLLKTKLSNICIFLVTLNEMKLTKYWKSSTSRVFLVTYHRLATIAKRQLTPINYRKSLAIMIISWPLPVWVTATKVPQKESFFMILFPRKGDGERWKATFLFGPPLIPLRITYLWVSSTSYGLNIDHSV